MQNTTVVSTIKPIARIKTSYEVYRYIYDLPLGTEFTVESMTGKRHHQLTEIEKNIVQHGISSSRRWNLCRIVRTGPHKVTTYLRSDEPEDPWVRPESHSKKTVFETYITNLPAGTIISRKALMDDMPNHISHTYLDSLLKSCCDNGLLAPVKCGHGRCWGHYEVL